jgi:hypothetical protein
MADWLRTWRKPLLGVAAALALIAATFGAVFILIDHREISTNWELRGVSEDGRTVMIGYSRYTCESLERVEKSETPSAVTLKVILRRPAAGCEIGVFKTVDVELARPLGSRELFGEHSTSWDVLDVSDDERALTVGYTLSGCEAFERVETSETPEKIALTVVVLRRMDRRCDGWSAETTMVRLARPLGLRKLEDGETGLRRIFPPPYWPGA